ncbi:hypothetical protein BKP35_13265 [Anaerobacillus arseniciselenatis]|uniref:Uncharacterized protein n=1 Tax=Anaerobacillus arseniciselenatis TaxID=85682 RepID=A0A1S2LF24_9BACI|nr:hypothetical protein [Anaerobacillus arseniciselenatis]OIJ10653.1 hypothetical protein BKP35_13265 [Anaerobacillus arseniciselenatis]
MGYYRPKLLSGKSRLVLFIFVVGLVITFIAVYHAKGSVGSVAESNKVTEINFNEHFYNLTELGISDFAKIQNFRLEFDDKGLIKLSHYELIEKVNNGFNVYKVRYSIDDKKYDISKSTFEKWDQYYQLVEAKGFFESLSFIILNDNVVTAGNGNQVFSSGWNVSYNILDQEKFLVENKTIRNIEDFDLPITGYYINFNGVHYIFN